MGVARGRCWAAGVVAGVLACVLAVAPSVSADVPSVPASGGTSQCVPDKSTIAQCFPDKTLAQAIAKKVKYNASKTGDVLTSQDVNHTTTLFFNSQVDFEADSSIASVQGLQVFTKLRRLDLRQTQVSDVSPLAKLTNLEFLGLSGTQVSDVSPLAGLTNLWRLVLSGTRVSDVSPLAKLTKLWYLDLSETRVSDVSPLAKLTKLEYLSLSGTRVSDVSPLAKLTDLVNLGLSKTQVSDVSPLAKLAKLVSLDLSGTRVSDATLSSLAKLTKLQLLGLSDTQVSDVSPLAKLTKLVNLSLSGTRVSDVSPLAELTDLVNLGLSKTQVSDVSPLAKLTKLDSLDLSGTRVSDATLSSVAKLTNLQSLDLSNTPVSDASPLAKLTNLHELNLSGTGVLNLGVLAGLSLNNSCDAAGVCVTSFAGVRPSVKLTVDGDGSVSMPAPRGLDGTWVAPSSTSPAGGVLDAKRGVVTWKGYDAGASYSYDFWKYFTLNDGGAVEFSGHVTGVKPVAKTFTVSFDSAGGSSVASQTVEYGAKVSVPKDPVKAGYAFQGWYTAKSGGSKYDFDKPVTGGLTLYARWKAVPKTFTVSFDSAGGSGVASQSVVSGGRVVKPVDPSRSGYVFAGWYTKDGKAFDFNSAVKSDVTLVARWRVVFRDVSSSTPHADDIAWLADAKVSEGWVEPDGSRTFRGMDSVKRQDMAAFLRREAKRLGAGDAASWKPSDKDWKQFRDVSRDTPHAEDVLWLAHANVSEGWREADGSYTFRGMDPVRRQDMAAFLRREATLMGVKDAASWKPSDKDWKRFRDVTRDTPHAEDVLWLAHANVSTGYADGTFGGMLPVYRQDMAAFLHRLDGLKK